MPPPVLPWFHSPVAVAGVGGYPAAFTSPADFLAALHKLVTDNGVDWSVASYDAVNGTLVLKPATGNLRVMYFGGQVPNAAALAGTDSLAGNSGVYLGYSMLGVDAPGVSYVSGAPFADWASGGLVRGSNASAHTHMRLHELGTDGAIVEHYAGGAAVAASGAGAFVVDPDSDTLRVFAFSPGVQGVSLDGINGWASNHWNRGVTNNDRVGPFDANTESAANGPSTRATLSDGVNSVIADTGVQSNGAANRLRVGNERYFVPVLLSRTASPTGYAGKLRQMAMGPSASTGEQYLEAGGIGALLAQAISATDGSVSDTLWLTDFAV